MKIAFISGIHENTGGNRILYHHYRILTRNNHKVDSYFLKSDQKPVANWENEKTFEYQIETSGKPSISDTLNEYDLLVANGIVGAIVTSKIDHPNKIWFCQNFDPYIFGFDYNGFGVNILDIYSHYDKFLTYSQDLINVIEKYTNCESFYKCPNGVAYELLKPFQKTGFIDSKRICFMTAYYNHLKGAKLANNIFRILSSKGYETVEININGGPLLCSQEYYRNPSLEKKCKIISGCDAMIHTSKFETWHLCSMESMALGTPVIGTNSYGIKEYVNDNNASIIESRDPEEIVNEILKVLSNENIYHSLLYNGIETAKQHSWKNISKKIVQTYESIK